MITEQSMNEKIAEIRRIQEQTYLHNKFSDELRVFNGNRDELLELLKKWNNVLVW